MYTQTDETKRVRERGDMSSAFLSLPLVFVVTLVVLDLAFPVLPT
jgi:hypothetical protein